MFWSITLLVKKMTVKGKEEPTKADIIAILASGFIGSLAYAFSESFWFSAVEGEVYAMSSLFTAVIFWAILKWDEEMAAIKHGMLSADYAPNRWLLLTSHTSILIVGIFCSQSIVTNPK
jgi:TRAP-type C4-dicarboxylate transport system permease large subunit